MDVTLITGASEGIGKELALLEAEAGRNVLLVARRETLLAALSQEIEGKYPVKAPIMICDLSKPGAASTLFQEIQLKGYTVTHLINNAGVGDFAAFRDSNPEKMEAMMQLNMMALAQLNPGRLGFVGETFGCPLDGFELFAKLGAFGARLAH